MRGWGSYFEAVSTNEPSNGRLNFFVIIYGTDSQHRYLKRLPVQTISSGSEVNLNQSDDPIFSNDQTLNSFAGSDFWLCDLGLEFLHWPQQKYLKQEPRVLGPSLVLESTNPNPGTNGYSRVVSWFDKDSLGLVEAYAYDVNGKKLKNFYPKDIKRVNGQWQVQTLVMENLQTGSKSRIEFDLKK